MTKRATITKRTRFAVFARDNFQCRYCGRQSDTVPMVIDHMIPVAAGGTNDLENLITACEPCNQGKADKRLEQHVPNDGDRLRLAQERNEQMRSAEAARQAKEAREAMERVIVDYWCEARDQTDYHVRTLRLITNFAMRYGYERVFSWIDAATARMTWQADAVVGKYICGIRRNQLAAGIITEDL